MMKRALFVTALMILTAGVFAQDTKLQQWKNIVSRDKKDTTTLKALDSLKVWYGGSITDSGLYYVLQMKNLAEAINNITYRGIALRNIAEKYFTEGRTNEALKLQYEALALAEESRDTGLIGTNYIQIGHSHKEYGDYGKAQVFYRKAYDIGQKTNREDLLGAGALNLGYAYIQLNLLDSALYFELQSYSITNRKFKSQLRNVEAYLGYLQYKMGNIKIAKEYYESALVIFSKTRVSLFGSRFIVFCNLGLANCFKTLNNLDSSLA